MHVERHPCWICHDWYLLKELKPHPFSTLLDAKCRLQLCANCYDFYTVKGTMNLSENPWLWQSIEEQDESDSESVDQTKHNRRCSTSYSHDYYCRLCGISNVDEPFMPVFHCSASNGCISIKSPKLCILAERRLFAFCKSCLLFIVNRKKWKKIENRLTLKNWKCIVCDPRQLNYYFLKYGLLDYCQRSTIGSFDCLSYFDVYSCIHYSHSLIEELAMPLDGYRPEDSHKYGCCKLVHQGQLAKHAFSKHSNRPIYLYSYSFFISYESTALRNFGGGIQYITGIIRNLHQFESIISDDVDYVFRYYYDKSVVKDELCNLLLSFLRCHPRVQLYEMDYTQIRCRETIVNSNWDELHLRSLFGTLCRLEALGDPILEKRPKSFVCIRDIDSIYNINDHTHLTDWVKNSNKPFHRYYCHHYDNPFFFGPESSIVKNSEQFSLTSDTYGGWPFLAGAFACKQRFASFKLQFIKMPCFFFFFFFFERYINYNKEKIK
ncbi:hypothetical protein RFI_07334 [Reticulomyxa filosa]|uniref:Uncharacterized protein n=1 Tax=Reticulomyxa filosa TaxID=46433 RepID=X6NUU3_RETFI|nr:hypothetical protein RFI_07334 [Reticulomyxa filosa]|eukprot:ETO29786.1 hypothetical protein RFI_07334 [Reticulomyxa filosa]